jgi:hypothetical protein
MTPFCEISYDMPPQNFFIDFKKSSAESNHKNGKQCHHNKNRRQDASRQTSCGVTGLNFCGKDSAA